MLLSMTDANFLCSSVGADSSLIPDDDVAVI